MSKIYEPITIDSNETLWNVLAQGWNKGLKDLGAHERVTAEQMQEVFGLSMEECVAYLLPHAHRKRPHIGNIMRQYEQEAFQRYLHEQGVQRYEQQWNEEYQISEYF